MTSADAKARSKSLGQELARPRRQAVVRLVVTRGEREGAQEDPPLDLRAEAGRPALDVDRQEVRVRGAGPVPDAVEARQVRGGLGAGDDVVDRDRGRGPRHRDRDDAAPPPRGRCAGRSPGSRRPPGRGPRPRPPRRNPTRSPSTPRSRAASGEPHLAVGGRGVERVRAGDDAVEASGVGDAARQRSDLIERGGERHQAVPRDAAVGRLEPDDAAAGRGLADRAARVRAEAGRHEARGDGRGAAARGAAGDPSECPRDFVVTCDELFSVDEPMANSSMLARPTKTAPARRSRAATVESPGGRKPSRILRGARGAPPGDPDVVLHRQRHAGERQVLSGRDPPVDGFGLLPGRARP